MASLVLAHPVYNETELLRLPLAFQEWSDERLAWQPERFGNLSDIILKADKIWLPELAIMNGLAQHCRLDCELAIKYSAKQNTM